MNVKYAIQKCKNLLNIFCVKNIEVESVLIKYFIELHHIKKLQTL